MTSSYENKPEWPEGVTNITWATFDRLGVGRDNHLYWDGHRVETRSRIRLNFWQALATAVIAIGTLLGGLGALAAGRGRRASSRVRTSSMDDRVPEIIPVDAMVAGVGKWAMGCRLCTPSGVPWSDPKTAHLRTQRLLPTRQ
jgi:hypothetical protein